VAVSNNSVLSGLRITGAGGGANIYCSAGAPIIRNCISDQFTHGIQVEWTASPIISNCIIPGDESCNFGISVSGTGHTEITNCLIYELCSYGIGCNGASATVDITNCTIADTGYVGSGGAGIYVSSGSVTVKNCIVWNPAAEDLYGCSATYSCIYDGDAGMGNISGDPNFVDAADGNYDISAGSPCIDAANNSEISDPNDLAGNPRKVDDPNTTDTGSGTAPIVDIGCYEYQNE
jgi:hypothetical protein